MTRNNLRKAALLGVPLNAPLVHPYNPLLLLRITHAAESLAERTRLTTTLLRGVWVDRLDAQSPDACAAYLDAAGLAGARLLAAADSDEARNALRVATSSAIAAGVFGVPSFKVGDEIFWGYDDLPYLERYLDGEGIITSAELAPWRACREHGVKQIGRASCRERV